ncbi:MAG TPA: glycosyltransferase [Roseiflexaceae bacterium]
MNPIEAKPTTHVAICISTYLRPIGLERLLHSLERLEFRKNDGVSIQVIVVDNDAAGLSRPIVERAAARLPWPVRYAIEPQRGVPFARNRAVALAAGCTYVAFVDDDEAVTPPWLDELLDARRRFDADVVGGPAIAIFEADPPRWVVDGGFFAYARYPSGTPIPHTSTNNVLMRRQVLDRIAGPFDPRFGMSGGSDSHLTTQLAQSGARLVWCDEAIVHEFVPASRVRTKWILQRAYRVGTTAGLRAMELSPTAGQLAERALRGVVCLAIGVGGLLPALFWRRAMLVRMLTYVARGVGIFFGLLGRRFEEYRTIHGT